MGVGEKLVRYTRTMRDPRSNGNVLFLVCINAKIKGIIKNIVKINNVEIDIIYNLT